MRKKLRKMAIKMTATMAVVFSALAGAISISSVEARAESSTFTYDSLSGALTGQITTSGANNITRLEFYFTNSYSYAEENVSLIDEETGSYVHLNADSVTVDGTLSNNAEVVYGGTVPVDDYNMNCIIYYVITEEDMKWTVNVYKDSYLSECMVAESTVPINWQDAANAVITSPLALDLYFVDSNTSSFTSMSQLGDVLNAHVQNVDTTTSNFQGEIKDSPKSDPLKKVLMCLILIVFIAIVITGCLLKKEQNKKEKKRSEEFVKSQNEKVKKKKARENDELKELVDNYDADYADEPEGYDSLKADVQMNTANSQDSQNNLSSQSIIANVENSQIDNTTSQIMAYQTSMLQGNIQDASLQQILQNQQIQKMNQMPMQQYNMSSQNMNEYSVPSYNPFQQTGYVTSPQDTIAGNSLNQGYSQIPGLVPQQNIQQSYIQQMPMQGANQRPMNQQMAMQQLNSQLPQKRVPAFARKRD